MIIRDEDLNGFVGKGDDFERLIHSLIQAEAAACGIAPDQINWDYRSIRGFPTRIITSLPPSLTLER